MSLGLLEWGYGNDPGGGYVRVIRRGVKTVEVYQSREP